MKKVGFIDLGPLRAGANSVPCMHLHSLPPTTTELVHLRTVLPPLSPGVRGRGVGGEGQSASRRRSGLKLRTWPRVPTMAPGGREWVFGGAAPSSPAPLPREARGRRGPEGFNINVRHCQCERNESRLRCLSRSISPGQPPHPQPFSPGKPGGEGGQKDSISPCGAANASATSLA